MTQPRAPAHLSKEAKQLWKKLTGEYQLDDQAGIVILTQALEAFDRVRGCQARIAEDGETIVDRFGQIKSHPLLATERDSRAAMLNALKALNLDLEPLDRR